MNVSARPLRAVTRIATLAAVLLTASACVMADGRSGPQPAGPNILDVLLGSVGVYGHGGQLHGEVRSVDTRRERITVRDTRGRNQRVLYDRRTRVVDGNRQYHPSSLRRGDRVVVQARQAGRNDLYATTIRVDNRHRQGSAAPGQRVVLDGTVGRIHRQGSFEVRDRSRGTVVVYLGRNARRSDIDRYYRLRSGDRVRVDGQYVARNAVELTRFR
jgi:hypothetical protein